MGANSSTPLLGILSNVSGPDRPGNADDGQEGSSTPGPGGESPGDARSPAPSPRAGEPYATPPEYDLASDPDIGSVMDATLGMGFDTGDAVDPAFDLATGLTAPAGVGWASPDDRLWRHPSEVGALSASEGPSGHPGGRRRDGRRASSPGLRSRRKAPASTRRVAVTAGVAGAIVAAGTVLLANTLLGAPVPGANGLVASRGPTGLATSQTSATGATSAPGCCRGSGASTQMTVAAMPTGASVAHAAGALRSALVAVEVRGPGKSAARWGAGLVIRSDGVILTTAGLVSGGTQLTAVTPDGKANPARVVGTDSATGVAVLRISRTGLHTVPNSTQFSGNVTGGQLVMTVTCSHAPTHLRTTVGEVVALDSHLTTDAEGKTALVDTIETDAPGGPNLVGGAVVDGRGQVLGIVDSVGQGRNGITDVVTPMWLAEGVATEILAGSSPAQHGWLDILGADAGPPYAPTNGAAILAVVPGGPAAAAGLQAGDVIVSVDGNAVNSLARLKGLLYLQPTGEPVTVTVLHHGAFVNRSVVLSSAPG